MPRDINFRRRAVRSEKGSVEVAAFDGVVAAGEIYFAISAPETIADSQEFLSARIPLIVGQKISVAVLFLSRTASHDVQGDATLNQTRERVDLLDKSSGLHQSRSISGNKLKMLCSLTERAADY